MYSIFIHVHVGGTEVIKLQFSVFFVDIPDLSERTIQIRVRIYRDPAWLPHADPVCSPKC